MIRRPLFCSTGSDLPLVVTTSRKHRLRPRVAADLEYVQRRSLRSDLGILARSIPALLYGSRSPQRSERDPLVFPSTTCPMPEAIEAGLTSLQEPGLKQFRSSMLTALTWHVGDRNGRTSRALMMQILRLRADGVGV